MAEYMKKFAWKDDVSVDMAMTALVAYPDLNDAVEFMAEQGFSISPQNMNAIRNRCIAPGSPVHQKFVDRQKELAPQLEKLYADRLLDQARMSTAVAALAVEQTRERLERGQIQDPSRVARDLQQVASQAVDKRLTLEERPTQIVERRTPDEILAKLEAMGVAKRVELDVPEAEVVED
ncbi:MAG TPA: hypothetical protein VMT20_07120 [Terriglobia bacterium]|nr:hypothetical protein [Terriglobia bacterium]